MPQNPHNPNQRISRLALLASFGVHRGIIDQKDADTLAAMNGIVNAAFFTEAPLNSSPGKIAESVRYTLRQAGVSIEEFKHLSDPNA